MLNTMKRLFQEEDGQGMVEYGLIIALVALGVIVVLGTMGETVADTFTDITDRLSGAGPVEPTQ